MVESLTADRRRTLVTVRRGDPRLRRRRVPPRGVREREQRQGDPRRRVVRRHRRRRPDARDPRRRHRPLRALGPERGRRALRDRLARARHPRGLRRPPRARARRRRRARQRRLHLVPRRARGRHDAGDERDHGRADARAHAGAHLRDVRARTRRPSLQEAIHSRRRRDPRRPPPLARGDPARDARPQLHDVRPQGLCDRQQPRRRLPRRVSASGS